MFVLYKHALANRRVMYNFMMEQYLNSLRTKFDSVVSVLCR